MKTRTLIRTCVGIFVSGLFAATALSGPGAEYWIRPAKPVTKPEAPKTEAPVVGKCVDCKTSPVWAFNNREPAGKGAPGARVVGNKHECARCSGAVVTEN